LQLHSPLRVWTTRAVIAVLALIGSYLIYEFGRIQAGYNLVDAAGERQELEQHITMLEGEILALKEQITLLETHRDIDRQAYTEVESSLTDLQAKIQEQKDAIAFYRGIVSPADGNKGLRVQDLKLTRGRAEREYNIRLVLVQAMQHDRKVSGNVKLTIDGDQDGVETTYEYAQLLPEDAKEAWAFSFRYFQDFDRQLVLPDGFTPQRVNIEVESRTRSIASIAESYSWETSQG
jgi:hypothetical protein